MKNKSHPSVTDSQLAYVTNSSLSTISKVKSMQRRDKRRIKESSKKIVDFLRTLRAENLSSK